MHFHICKVHDLKKYRYIFVLSVSSKTLNINYNNIWYPILCLAGMTNTFIRTQFSANLGLNSAYHIWYTHLPPSVIWNPIRILSFSKIIFLTNRKIMRVFFSFSIRSPFITFVNFKLNYSKNAKFSYYYFLLWLTFVEPSLLIYFAVKIKKRWRFIF